MLNLFKSIRFNRNNDFASKVLVRYSSNKSVSSFAKQLFNSEDAESINARFKKAKLKAAE